MVEGRFGDKVTVLAPVPPSRWLECVTLGATTLPYMPATLMPGWSITYFYLVVEGRFATGILVVEGRFGDKSHTCP